MMQNMSKLESAVPDRRISKTETTIVEPDDAPSGVLPRTYESVDAADLKRFGTTSGRQGLRSYETSAVGWHGGVTESSPSGGSTRASKAEYTETSSPESVARHLRGVALEDDALSATSMDSVEEEMLEYFENEAHSCMNGGDWPSAEENIVSLLACTSIPSRKKQEWNVQYARVLDALGQWDKILEVLEGAEGGDAKHYRAKAYFNLGKLEKAKDSCFTAIKIKRKEGDTVSTGNESVELMANILDVMGKRPEARFYRSKLPNGYVSRISTDLPAPAKKEEQSIVASLPESSAVNEANVPWLWGYERGPTSPQEETATENQRLLSDEDRAILASLDISYDDQEYCLQGTTDAIFKLWRYALEIDISENLISVTLLDAVRTGKALLKTTSEGICALHLAAHYGAVHYIKHLYELGAPLEAGANLIQVANVICRGMTPLHVAVKRESVEAADALIKLGANIGCRDFDGSTPLHHAVYFRSLPMAKFLVSNGAPLEVKHWEEGFTPLHYAILLGNIEVAGHLMDNGADNLALTATGCSCVHLAGGMATLKLLTAKGLLLTNARNEDGETALHFAARSGSTKVAEYLLDHHFDVSAVSTRSMETPLHLVMFDREIPRAISKIRLFISRGASTEIVNGKGLTVLQNAARNSSASICKCMLECGAIIGALSSYGCTALHLAVLHLDQEQAKLIARILLRARINTKVKAKDGRTALGLANFKRNTVMEAFLKEHGVSK